MASPLSIVKGPRLVLKPGDPRGSAKSFIDLHARISKILSLRHHAGVFYRYTALGGYQPVEEAAVRAMLYAFLDQAQNASNGGNFEPTSRKVSDVLDALRSLVFVPAQHSPPCWMDGYQGDDPLDFLPCANGLLHLPTRELRLSSPLFFATNGLAISYTKDAPSPTLWHKFLKDLWHDDEESIAALQEWFGYLLTARTHFQKILLIVGPPRSGKGTIARIIRALLGESRVCTPTMSSIAEHFGRSGLINKSLALMADARLGGRVDVSSVVEALLSISGEDHPTISRKHLPDWNGKLFVRFVLMTNELPKLEDASGALASRFIVLMLRESFYNREDHQLSAKLQLELPGILNWALDGWARLSARDRFLQPTSSAEVIQQLADLGSPIKAFLRDKCDVSGGSIRKDTLYEAWKQWCKDVGRDHPSTTYVFGRNLRAALPFIKETHPRVAGKQTGYYEGLKLAPDLPDDDRYVV